MFLHKNISLELPPLTCSDEVPQRVLGRRNMKFINYSVVCLLCYTWGPKTFYKRMQSKSAFNTQLPSIFFIVFS